MRYGRILIITTILLTSLGSFSVHADTLGQNVSFFTNTKYDYSGRTQINATLYATSAYADYYVEDSYWANLGPVEKANFTNTLNQVAQAFDGNIYPKETTLWGSVGALGAGSNQKVTILLEHLTTGTGGYFDSTNEYPIRVSPTSNYRSMIIINADSLNNSPRTIKSLIAHEFQHLISFNQKDLLRSMDEDIWLNELRSEYSIDFVGYNEPFQDSPLQRRVPEFLSNPSDSLTEWLNKPFEYGAISLFGKYLVEQYGTGILKETLQSSKTGIASINDYLRSHNYQETFETIFRNWVVTNYLNNHLVTPGDTYRDQDLDNIHVSAVENNLFYPFSYTYSFTLKPWQPAWYKFNLDPAIPKSKALKLDFGTATDFGLVYMDKFGTKEVTTNPMYITNMASLSSFVLATYNRSQTSGFTDNDPAKNLVINISFVDSTEAVSAVTKPVDGSLIKKLGGTDIYVITGKYKRLMSPSAIVLYGHLDPRNAQEVSANMFDSFPTSNYIRAINTRQIYAIWYDNSKHLIKTSFAQLGRDPNLVFTVNPLELNFYKTGKSVPH